MSSFGNFYSLRRKKSHILNSALKPSYVYISSSLKDSFELEGDIIPAFKDKSYKDPFYKFIDDLARRTSQRKIPTRYRIVEGRSGKAAEFRMILRAPHGWPQERFLQIALEEWAKNPSVDIVIAAYAKRSVDMELDFLDPDCKGRRKVA